MANQNQPETDDDIAREGDPFAIEDMGVSNEAKINSLLETAITVREELQTHIRKVLVGLTVAGLFIVTALGAAGGVLHGLSKQSDTLTDIATDNRENGRIARRNSEILLNATGPEARARSSETLSKAIAEIGRVGVCAAFYVVDEYPPACEDVTANMDRMRAGENPYEGSP